MGKETKSVVIDLEKTCTMPWTKASSMQDGLRQCAAMKDLKVNALVRDYEGGYATFIDPESEVDAKNKLGNVARIH